MCIRVIVLILFSTLCASALQTNYDLYTANGISSGLSVDRPDFTLNGKNISIYSGAIHYFRVPRVYWRNRLTKLRAAGFNAVETYIPWNLHEPQSGVYDFGNGGSEMEDFLHLETFIELAQREDLFVIIRAGPFICAEFEYGGFPSWLLRERDIAFRSSNSVYMQYVSRWFNVLLPILAKHQFTKGGAIIMFQVENEFAQKDKGNDKTYLNELRQLMLDNGIVEILSTADNPWRGVGGTIRDEFFMTGNFDSDAIQNLDYLRSYQPGKPIMVMEYWSGWFDYWGTSHQTKAVEEFEEIFEQILWYPASVNVYMFIGGTNFGFLSGAENLAFDDLNTKFSPITTSYDYTALLTEAGDYTDKYYAAQRLIAKYNPFPTLLPEMPALVHRKAYSSVAVQEQITLYEVIPTLPSFVTYHPVSMENMDINNGNGQSYGYVVYRKTLDLDANSLLKIVGRVCDTVIVLVNGKRVSPVLAKAADLNNFGTWRTENSSLKLTDEDLRDATLDLVVENWGRVNVGVYYQPKGLWQGDIEINGEPVHDWLMYPLEFKKSWTDSLSQWKTFAVSDNNDEPKIYRGNLEISDTPRDTYVDMENWTKGIVIVNGFVLGRYARIGPQQTLYLPAPFLIEGSNQIVVFEEFTSDSEVKFVTDPLYKNN
ncbi:beta-galactosidase-1-like protein 3 [Cylas formicarius]|uniref:beta-galactosidase-1-like protein 3 n=1 Tax=Cylas formicarius TaxID=197179 RepID=UPI00295837E2|nr:beta-galactosidase-1-like protein 3 [Cylas formicarius]